MKEYDILQLSAYMDKQLDAAATAELERRLEQEPELRQYLEQLGAIEDDLRLELDSINDEPLPEALQQLLAEDAGSPAQPEGDNVVAFPNRRSRQFWPAAIAASITLGLGFIFGMNQYSANGPGSLMDQVLQPSGAFAQALDSQASGTAAPVGSSQIDMELSFVHHNGALCRQYLVHSQQSAIRSVSCKTDGQWKTVVMAPTVYAAADNTQYLPASAQETPAIISYLSEHMAGIPLNAEQERQQLEATAK